MSLSTLNSQPSPSPPVAATIAALESDYDARLREVAAREETRRDAAFVEAPASIGGLPIRMMNLVDYLVLLASGNAHVAFATAPESRLEEIAFWAKHDEAALWLLSLDFSREPGARKKFFDEKVASLSAIDIHAELLAYFEEVFADAPRPSPGEGGSMADPVRVSFAAWWLRDVASVVPWSRAELRAMPLPEFFQYLRIARAEAAWKAGKNPPPVTDETDRLMAEKLERINQVLADDRAAKKGAA